MKFVACLEQIKQDIGYALRWMPRKSVFSVAAIVLLALGIGATTAIFSIMDAIVLKRLPVTDPDRLVVLGVTNATSAQPGVRFSYPTIEQLHDLNQVLDGLFTWQGYQLALGVGSDQVPAQSVLVSGDYFATLGISAQVGRTLLPTDDKEGDPQAVMVISDGLWNRRFAKDPHVVGKVVSLNGYPFTIVGVAPSRFSGVDVGSPSDLWAPLHTMNQLSLSGAMLNSREAIWLPAMARLKRGLSIAQATSALTTRLREVRRQQGVSESTLEAERIQLLPGSRGLSKVQQQFSAPLKVLMILVILILVVACANLANLLLANAIARSREIIIRLAIGASRERLVRQLLTESFVLMAFGVMLGIGVAEFGVRTLTNMLPAMRHIHPAVDGRALLFCCGISIFSLMLFGLAPAWVATKINLAQTLKSETSSVGQSGARMRLRNALVVSQIALSFILVFGAGLFVRTLQMLRGTEIGLTTDHVIQLSINPGGGYVPAQLQAAFQQALQDIQHIAGVRSAAFVNSPLLSGAVSRMDIYPPGYQRSSSNEDVFSVVGVVDPGFFQTVGIPLLQGRDFVLQDTKDSPKVIIVNEAVAHFFFPSGDPIGRSVGIAGAPEYHIIGVVGNSKFRDLREKSPRIVYVPFSQQNWPLNRTAYIRTNVDPTSVLPAVRRTIGSYIPKAVTYDAKSFSDQVDDSLAQERVTAWLSSFFGALALAISAVGLYGLMSHAVSRRTREIGLRMALGASRLRIISMVLRETLSLVTLGILLGGVVAIVLSNLVASLLYGVKAQDPLAMMAAVASILIIAALAAYLPAQRAASIEPSSALRQE